MTSMHSMRASMRRHPSYSYSYEIPEPRSHVKVLDNDVETDIAPIANVIDLAAARQRRRAAEEATG